VALTGACRLHFDDRGAGSDATAAAADADNDDPSLVAYYPMDSLVSGVTPDIAHQHDATCTTCPSLIASPHGGAVQFHGTTEQLIVAGNPAFETTAAVTVTAWIRIDVLPGGVDCYFNKPFGATVDNSWQVCVKDILSVFYGQDTQGVNVETQANALMVGRWSHIAYRWTGTTRILSIDGTDVLMDSATIMFDGSGLSFGVDVDGGTLIAPVRGSIDELRIYNRALDSAEITALAEQ
jgi:hypothetical protein